jgi:hypothetical protein
MSPIAIGLDGLLIILLLITFTIGLRLERRLKGLRADHVGFAKAVSELDQALARAEAGLRDMRNSASETQAALADRIQEARAAAVRLDELTAKAAKAPQPAPRPAEVEERGVLELSRPTPVREAPAAVAAPVEFETRRDARSRARVDEDLFEAEAEAFPRLRFAAGGRR